ncbi:hypothetical protein INH39_28890 [Massilia violaceinigra]|uniref:Uncharacterized protein n=1 Tax=Massilia violaceinigra TaxID=2045208 RepID=A0ABY4A9W5_9BURK|nr:hypothetical protein [Massilia violaceinigra]UOD29378.1 hypothetical protein INH39_28890 [Massilia violaceinigra]
MAMLDQSSAYNQAVPSHGVESPQAEAAWFEHSPWYDAYRELPEQGDAFKAGAKVGLMWQMENPVERLVVGSDARVKTGGMFDKCIDDAEYSTLATDFTCYNQAEI